MINVSVVIPVYNQKELLKKCLDSIPKREDIEIIVIDDGSTDGTKEVIEDYVNKFPTFIGAIICKTNYGLSNARNLGIEKACGHYIMFIDSDDYIEGDKLLHIIDSNKYTDYDIIFYDMILNNGTTYNITKKNKEQFCGMFKLLKREFIGDTRFPVGVQYAEDMVFHKEIMAKRPKVLCTGIVLYHYNYPREGSLCDLHEKGLI